MKENGARTVELPLKYTSPFEPALCAVDLDAQIEFYCRVLQFRHVGTVDVPAALAARTSISKLGYRVARLEDVFGNLLKLVSIPKVDSARPARRQVLERRGDCYVTFFVESLADTLSRLQQSGAPITSEGIVEVRPGVRLIFARDPEDNALEFVERASTR